MTTEVKTNCRFSVADEPCVIRNPDKEQCRACLIATAERELKAQDVCCRYGERTYEEFKATGRAHVCGTERE